jgi:hypothetical protein
VYKSVTTLLCVVGLMRRQVATHDKPNGCLPLSDVAAIARANPPESGAVAPFFKDQGRGRGTNHSRYDDATAVWTWIGHDYDDGIGNLAKVANTSIPCLVNLLQKEGRFEAEEGKGGVKRYGLESLLLLAAVVGVGLVILTQLSDQPHAVVGRLAVASRSFHGPTALAFTVAEFETEAQAQEGMQALAARLEARPVKPGELDLSQLEEVSVPALRDGVRAYRGQVPLGDVTADVGYLLVHDGQYVHVMQSLSANGAPTAPVELAGRLFGPGPYLGLAAAPAATPSAENSYRTGGLWDRLPRPEQLPPGYRVAAETEGFDPTLFGSAG